MENYLELSQVEEGFTGSGFGVEDGIKSIEDLNKALTVGYGYALADKTGGGALRLESLEETLKIITFKEQQARFWFSAPKKKAESTVEEYTTVEDVEGAQFYAEGGVPEVAQDDLRRAFEQVKFLGAIGKISDVITNVKTQANARMVEQANKTRAMVRLADKTGWFGDSRFNSYEYDGILRQIERKAKYPTQNIIDLRGKRMRLSGASSINDGVTIIADNYGNAENVQLWMSPQAKNDYINDLITNKQFWIGGQDPNAIIGIAGKQFEVANGSGKIQTDVFLGQYPERKPYPRLNTAGNAFVSTHEKAPEPPDATSTLSIDADTATLLPAATYDYAVVAVNRFGASTPLTFLNNVVAANKRVTFTIVEGGSVTGQEATCYRIYRKLSSATLITDWRYLYTASATDVTTYDNGYWMPDTYTSILIEWDSDQVFAFHQLLPMFKKPLASIGDYEWWLQKLYVTPIVYNANKMVVYRNCGSMAWS